MDSATNTTGGGEDNPITPLLFLFLFVVAKEKFCTVTLGLSALMVELRPCKWSERLAVMMFVDGWKEGRKGKEMGK